MTLDGESHRTVTKLTPLVNQAAAEGSLTAMVECAEKLNSQNLPALPGDP